MEVVERALIDVAGAVWHTIQKRKDPIPDDMIPKPKEFWASLSYCPQDAFDDAYNRTFDTCKAADRMIASGTKDADELKSLALNVMLSMVDPQTERASKAVDDSDEWLRIYRTDGTSFDTQITGIHLPIDLRALCELWDMLPAKVRPKHPLAPLVLAWQNRPTEAEPETRTDKRIVPVVRWTESRPERQRGMLFGGLLDGREPPKARLPLFEAEPARKSVAILDIADKSGVPIMARGRGAPLEARLFVRAGMSVRPEDRLRQSVRMALTVRDLRNGLFPNGWQAGRDWPKLRAALEGARDYTIRLPDGGLWFMFALRRLPSEASNGTPSLDDFVVLDIAYPPGAGDGPPVDLPTLDALSVDSAPKWRAAIAAIALSWSPGVTQRPVPGAKGRFGWSRNANDYPVLTQEDRRRFAFGETDTKHRTRAQIDDPWRDLPGLTLIAEQAVDPKTGEVGWRYVPEAVADKIKSEDPDSPVG